MQANNSIASHDAAILMSDAVCMTSPAVVSSPAPSYSRQQQQQQQQHLAPQHSLSPSRPQTHLDGATTTSQQLEPVIAQQQQQQQHANNANTHANIYVQT